MLFSPECLKTPFCSAGIANDTAERVYVIDKESYELIYTSESAGFLCQGADCIGQKCYAALYGKISHVNSAR